MIADEPVEVRNVGGRPSAEIDIDVVRNAAKIGCTTNEIAALLGVARSTLFKHMAADPSIQLAIEEGRDLGCGTLRRYQWHKAEAGSDTMLIWLGKQMLGQKDKSELTGADDGPVRVAIEFVGEAPAQRVEAVPVRSQIASDVVRAKVDFVG